MKFQSVLYTTAFSLAMAVGSSAAFAEGYDQSKKSHDSADSQSGYSQEATTRDEGTGDAMNTNDVEKMREKATDEELPNRGSRAVPGAADAGKNESIEPAADHHDFVE